MVSGWWGPAGESDPGNVREVSCYPITCLPFCCSLVAQLCLTLCNPMDYSLPGSSVNEISQARILEWVAISFSRVSSQPRNWTQISCIAGRFFTNWANLLICTLHIMPFSGFLKPYATNYSVISIFKLCLGIISFPPSIKCVQVFSILKQSNRLSKQESHS